MRTPSPMKAGRCVGRYVASTVDDRSDRSALLGSRQLLQVGGAGDWIISSDIRAGETANANGLADVRLLHIAGTSAQLRGRDQDPAGSRL